MIRDKYCGIYFPIASDHQQLGPRQWLPVESFSAHANIILNSARLVVKQIFINPRRIAIAQATYIFPTRRSASATVVGFRCQMGERILHGAVRENRMEAAEGEVKKPPRKPRPDVWSTEIGKIPARCKVEVEITLVYELERKHDPKFHGTRFVMPTKIASNPAPVYRNPARNFRTERCSTGALQIVVAVTMASPIKSLRSPSHPIEVTLGRRPDGSPEEFDPCIGYATLSHKEAGLDRNFFLDIIVEGIDTGQPQAVLETHPTLPDSKALLLSFNPQFQMPRFNCKSEVVFIADTSAAMENRIQRLEKALKVLMKSLPVGVKFNLCWFDRDHRFLWPKGSRPYNQKNLNAALKYVETFTADHEFEKALLPPLEKAFRNRCKDMRTEIIVLTDGDLRSWNSKLICELVSANCKSKDVRVFALGIGCTEAKYVQQVKNLARAGRGDSQIVRSDSQLDATVVQMLKAALGAHYKECHLEFPASEKSQALGEIQVDGGSESALAELRESEATNDHDFIAVSTRLQTPHQILPDFISSRTNIYTILPAFEVSPPSVMVRRSTASGESADLEVPVKDVGVGSTVHQLAARKYLQELEERHGDLQSGKVGIAPKDQRKLMIWHEREAVRVGTTFEVGAGKWTSFVAVENGAEVAAAHQIPENVDKATNNDEANQSSSAGSMFHLQFSNTLGAASPRPKVNSAESPYGYLLAKLFQGMWLVARYMTCCFSTYDVLRDKEEEERGIQNENEERETRLLIEVEDSSIPIVEGVLDDVDGTSESSSDSDDKEHTEDVDVLNDDALPNKTYALVQRQAFDGSFPPGSGIWAREMSGKFKQWIQQENEKGSAAAAVRDSSALEVEKLVASAAAVAIVREELMDCQAVWEMMLEKTDAWAVGKVGKAAWNAVKQWVCQEVRKAYQKKLRPWPWLTQKKRPKYSGRAHETHVPWSQMLLELHGPLSP